MTPDIGGGRDVAVPDGPGFSVEMHPKRLSVTGYVEYWKLAAAVILVQNDISTQNDAGQ